MKYLLIILFSLTFIASSFATETEEQRKKDEAEHHAEKNGTNEHQGDHETQEQNSGNH